MQIKCVDEGWEVYNGSIWYIVGSFEDGYSVYDSDGSEMGGFGNERYSSYNFESCLMWIYNS